MSERRRCPRCNLVIDGATEVGNDAVPVGEGQPKAGDLCVCAYCSTVSVFESPEVLRLITDADIEVLDTETLQGLLGNIAFAEMYQRYRERAN